MASTVFSGSLIHTADLISPLIGQIEHIERAEEASEHLPQEEKYVVRDPVTTDSGTKIRTHGQTRLRVSEQPQGRCFKIQSLKK